MNYKSLLLLLTGSLGLTLATAQKIYTKAGTGNPGDYASALNTRFLGTGDIALDASGNIYVVDGWRIRRINAADGKIYPVAGTGILGYSGDGGPATAAQMYPWGIALNTKGDLFLTDVRNHSVHKVSAADGKITRIAGKGTSGFSGDGGLATDAQLNFPSDVAVDAAGNVYIADGYNGRVRKVDATTGKIITIAGTGNWGFSGDGGLATAADFSSIGSLALDAAGNLYLADVGNYRIRKITIADGKVNTIAGNGDYGYNDAGNGGPGIAAAIGEPQRVTVDDKNNIFFSDLNYDSYTYRVRKISATDGTIQVVAGTGMGAPPSFQGDGGPAVSAPLSSPNGVGVDKTGNLFIADGQNARIRKVNAADQIINTIAGIGNIYGPATTIIGDLGPAALARLQSPTSTAVDANGNVYISDNGINCLRKVNAADGIITTIAGDGTTTGFSGDGGPAKAAKLNLPNGNYTAGAIILDKAGNIYFSDGFNYRIRKINAADGIISTIAGTGAAGGTGDGGQATAAAIGLVNGLAFDSKGDLYFISRDVYRLRKINMTTGVITTVVGNGLSYGGRTGATSGDGGLASAARMMLPRSIAIDRNDNIYFGESSSRLRKVNASDGIVNTIAGTGTQGFSGDNGPAIAAQLNTAFGMTIDASDNLYIADYTENISDPLLKNHLIRKINLATGIITTIAGKSRGYSGDGGLATLATMDRPNAVTLDTKGNLFITDQNNGRVRYICNNQALSAIDMKETRAAYPEDTTTPVAFNNNCAVICDLIPEGDLPVAGFITGKVWVAGNVLLSNDRPYVQRHYEIAPELNANNVTGTVNLYFTQAEFDAYNAGAKVVDGVYLPLPANATDVAGNKQFLRIVYAKGVSNDNSGLLSTYGADTTVIIPTIEWDAANNWWKLSFSAKGLGGFFVTTVKVPIPKEDNLFVPNMFSPNADGKNDRLMVYGNHLNTVRLLVFNQWGQKVYETSNGNTDGWDGTAGGKPQPVGVYMFVLEAKLDDGTILRRKGSTSLIR